MNKRVVVLFLLLLPFTADVVSATNRPGSNFNANVISDVETAAPLQFTPEDIALCCTGNGDFGFMMRDLQVGELAEDTAEEGFLSIPGSEYLGLCSLRECYPSSLFPHLNILFCSYRQFMVLPQSVP